MKINIYNIETIKEGQSEIITFHMRSSKISVKIENEKFSFTQTPFLHQIAGNKVPTNPQRLYEERIHIKLFTAIYKDQILSGQIDQALKQDQKSEIPLLKMTSDKIFITEVEELDRLELIKKDTRKIKKAEEKDQWNIQAHIKVTTQATKILRFHAWIKVDQKFCKVIKDIYFNGKNIIGTTTQSENLDKNNYPELDDINYFCEKYAIMIASGLPISYIVKTDNNQTISMAELERQPRSWANVKVKKLPSQNY